MRKSYGATWWGQQWLKALHDIDYSNRLPRGRTYANKGAVRDIRIEKNRISAQVQGTRPRPYLVQIEIPVFTPREKARIVEIVTANPLFLSQLLNRELPAELYASCLQKGIHIFPDSWHDLSGSCSCPDWAVPCKHMAATLYLVANEIDKNPFLAFELHHFDLFEALEQAGYTSGEEKAVHIPRLKALLQPYQSRKEGSVWNDELFAELDFTTIPDCREQILQILSPNAVFYPEGDWGKILELAYRQVARSIPAEAPDDNWDAELVKAESVKIILDEELYLIRFTGADTHGRICAEINDMDELTTRLRSISLGRIGQLSEDMRGLVLSFRLAEKLAEKSAFVPQLLDLDDGDFIVRWLPAYLHEAVWETADLVEMLTPAHLLSYESPLEQYSPREDDAFPALVSLFLNHLVQDALYFHDPDLVLSLFFEGWPVFFDDFENREQPAAIQLWLNRLYITEKDHVPVIQVEDTGPGFQVSIGVEDKTQPFETPIPLSELFENDERKALRLDILRDLSNLTEFFPQISQLVASKGQAELLFNAREFPDILLRVLPTIRLFGIRILLPKALRKLLRPRISLEMKTSGKDPQANSLLGLENLLRFQWQVALGDQLLSPEAFRQEVDKLSGIVRLNEQYIYFDEKDVKALIHKLENPPALNGHQLLQAALTEEYQGAPVKLDRQAQKLLDQLLNGPPTALPEGLQATLRPYQTRGYEWLYKNARLGFGSLIADDMGLGKTLQVITALLKLKEEGELKEKKALVVVPTTLLTNWDKEIQRFAPALKTHIYHGPGRSLAPLAGADILLTTYGVARSEQAALQKMNWLLMVIDEAQNIKNPETQQTKAIKKIGAPLHIAMSGTPVENRLSEYWSIMDFANRGYLGSLKHFREEFARPIELDRDHNRLERFRRITAPFILRRVKTDRSIISDLPDKIEQNQYCQLTTEQAALYQSVIDSTLEAVESADGIERQGLVLKLITALKQVCNHPAHFLKKGEAVPALSGKTGILVDLLQQVAESDEKALIFTQYREMGQLLAGLLKREYGAEPLFLHGGVSRKQRDAMVEDFQNNRTTRFFLLSLKAGGTGLNLTAASQVFHYDLWWNPAVENQATDRAYRIGQQRNVLVHRLITQGTFEEKIDRLVQSKKELAELAVASGEKWVGDLSNEELRELVLLA